MFKNEKPDISNKNGFTAYCLSCFYLALTYVLHLSLLPLEHFAMNAYARLHEKAQTP